MYNRPFILRFVEHVPITLTIGFSSLIIWGGRGGVYETLASYARYQGKILLDANLYHGHTTSQILGESP
jgi:hypothetical protein